MVNSLSHFDFDVSYIIMFRKIIHHQFRVQIKSTRQHPCVLNLSVSNLRNQACEIVHWYLVLAAKSDDLSLVPETHMEREPNLENCL